MIHVKWDLNNSREFARWDERMSCFPPEILEIMNNNQVQEDAGGDFFMRQGDAHLKENRLNLNHLDLTDKQLIAVSLVFYGG